MICVSVDPGRRDAMLIWRRDMQQRVGAYEEGSEYMVSRLFKDTIFKCMGGSGCSSLNWGEFDGPPIDCVTIHVMAIFDLLLPGRLIECLTLFADHIINLFD